MDEVLRRWVPAEQLQDDEPFGPVSLVRSHSASNQLRMLDELDRAIGAVTLEREWGSSFGMGTPFGLALVPHDESVCFVPIGRESERRLVYAGLYADHVVLVPRRQPVYRVEGDVVRMSELLGEGSFAVGRDDREVARVLGKAPTWPDVQAVQAWTAAAAAIRREANGHRELAATSLLWFVWNAHRPLREGWLQLIGPAAFSQGHIDAMREAEEYRAVSDAILGALSNRRQRDAWCTVFDSYRVGMELGRGRAVAVPAEPYEAELLAATARFFESPISTEETLDRSPRSRPRQNPASEADVMARLPGWFGELIVALGPFTEHLDGNAVSELRAAGTRDDLRHWLDTDLRRVVQAAAAGED